MGMCTVFYRWPRKKELMGLSFNLVSVLKQDFGVNATQIEVGFDRPLSTRIYL